MKPGLAALVLVASCASNGTSSPKDVQTVAETTSLKPFGAPCTANEQCAAGLCLDNDVAPFSFCSATCTTEREACVADAAGVIGGYCVKMPSAFKSTPNQFCLPICDNITKCTGMSPQWSKCSPPQYENVPIYGTAVKVNVCQTPSANGKGKVDTTTCADWETKYGAGFTSQVSLCKAYCDYLVKCHGVTDPATYNQTCCAYGCLVQMTADGTVNVTIEKKRKCYLQNYSSWMGTPKVCTAHEDQPICGDPPDDPAPKP